MSNLFRKIRQKRWHGENLRKYLLYGIGEIFLVVIGILIAIQLNNVNENRKSEKRGMQLLVHLNLEIKQDITYFNYLLDEYDLWYAQTNYLLDSILSGEVNELKNIEQYNIGRGSLNFLYVNKNSYNELIIAENSIVVSNKLLKTKIESYYHFADVELKKLNADNELFYQWLLDNTDMTTWHRLYVNRNLGYENWSWLKDPSSEEFRRFEGRVLFFQNALKVNQAQINLLLGKAHNLNKMIDTELGE